MSDILIKGIKFPDVGVRDVVIAFANNCMLITDKCGKELFYGEYVEIPTHGRLIDADAYQYSGDLIDEPTIIEAEGVNG